MNREVHVRFWEGLGVQFPRATQLGAGARRSCLTALWSVEGHPNGKVVREVFEVVLGAR